MIELFTRKNSKKIPKNTKKEISPLIINDNEEETFNIENNNISSSIYNSYNSKKKCYIPFIIYILIFTFILFIISIILLIWTYNNKEIYYTFDKDIYIKPNISEHNYSKIHFNNNLEIVITQVNINDTAGGAISFERGYLDKKYEPGFLSLAFLNLRFNDINTSRYLTDYMGDLTQAQEEFYSSVYFTILNYGFQKYLSNFNNYESYNESNFKNDTDRTLRRMSFRNFTTAEQREKYLIEYLVYDIKDENGKDINRQGVENEVRKRINYDRIKEIMKELFIPKKIKLIFFTHYKMSLTKKLILRYLHDLTTNNQTSNETEISYDNINTNKIIFHNINNYENNYIKINYYIKNENATLNQIYHDLGYFNYLKYILNETNENSLYYNLTHPKDKTNGINIKSLFCDFDVVLKNRIRFTILIRLNNYSYHHIKEIIQTIYTYMEQIKSHVNNMRPNDERISELLFINEQNFSFTEDVHNGEFYKNKAKDLFYRDDKNYFLREVWIPSDLNETNINIKFYTDKLSKKNSVVIIGLNNYTIDKYNISDKKNDIAFIFENIEKTNFSEVCYSINDLDKLNINIPSINNFTELTFYKNEFISNYTCENIQIKKDENNIERKYDLIDGYNDLIKFYWLKDTYFKLPKVFYVYVFFHPYLRPNSTGIENKDKIFYHLVLYLAYIQRQIDLRLTDAIRAGTIFKLGYRENYIYLDILAFSDILEKIIKIIKDIIVSIDYDKLKEDYYIYKDYALENLANFYNENQNNILKYEFYKQVSIKNELNFPPVYNIFLFKQKDFLDFTDISQSYINNIIFPVMKAYILGYYEKEQVENLFNLHKEYFTQTHFSSTLIQADYNCGSGDSSKLNGDEFVKYIISRQNLTKTLIINNATYIRGNRKNIFMNFVQFSDNNRIPVEIFKRINRDFNTRYRINMEVINQKIIYLRISFNKNYNSKDIIESMKETINKSKNNMTKPLDIIGGRFYYLIRNYENEYNKTPNGIEEAALAMTYNQIYNRTEVYNYPIDPDNYDEFNRIINSFFEQSGHYVEFSNNNSNE